MILKVNTDELVKFTAKLEKLHRSALPVAIRETLTKAAKDVKTRTMPKSTDKTFKKRQPNFFKANSKFDKAEGFDIKKMKATVGFYDNKLAKAATNYAVKDLEKQERSGAIRGRSFIAMKQARSGRGLVRSEFRMDSITKGAIITAREFKGSRKQGFIRAAFMAKKTGKNFVLGNKDSTNSRTLSRINSVSNKGGKLVIKRTPLYRVKGGRVVTVNRTNFMKRAAEESALNLNKYYMEQAQKQFAKVLK